MLLKFRYFQLNYGHDKTRKKTRDGLNLTTHKHGTSGTFEVCQPLGGVGPLNIVFQSLRGAEITFKRNSNP